MQPAISTVKLFDTLADITSQHDPKVLERSLIETLSEYHDSSEFWFYKVMTSSPEINLGLLAYSTQTKIVTTPPASNQPLPAIIRESVFNAIQEAAVQVTATDSGNDQYYIIYPAEDHRKDVFAVLIEKLTSPVDMKNREVVHSFLRVYSNYLKLIEQSHKDKLTGVLNRETLEEEIKDIIIRNNNNIPHNIDSEPRHATDLREPKEEVQYWLGVLDIDHFKQVNDMFGHLYGDDILILVARYIVKSVRDYDLVFRFGGEEFVILLKAENVEYARKTFERIRMAVGHHDYAKAKQVTVSIGVTEIRLQTTTSEVISEADSALYYAKTHGRDQLRFYHDLIRDALIKKPDTPAEAEEISYF